MVIGYTQINANTKINGNNHRTLLFTVLNATDIIITDIIIHAKVFSVTVISVIIMTDKVGRIEANSYIVFGTPTTILSWLLTMRYSRYAAVNY